MIQTLYSSVNLTGWDNYMNLDLQFSCVATGASETVWQDELHFCESFDNNTESIGSL